MNHSFAHQYHQPGVSDWQSQNLSHHQQQQQQHNYPNAQAQAAAAAQQAAMNQQNAYGRGAGTGGGPGNNGFSQNLGDARGLGGGQGLGGGRDLGGQGFGGRDMGRDVEGHGQGFGQRDGGGGFVGNGGAGGPGGNGGDRDNMSEENRKVLDWIAQTLNAGTREAALLELSKKREQVSELALILWHSFGVMTSLLQEIISVYPLLNPSQLTAAASNRVCNALALLQCVASHPETRGLFLGAHIPLFLYPFLNTTSKSRPFEYLRLTSLGVIGALVKNDSSDVINFLLTTEIIPLCLRIMETGSELSKTVAIFIVQKILLDDMGLQYICQTYERFYAVGTVLSNMVTQLVDQQTVRLLKHVVRCFLRLSDNARAREALRQCLPEPLRDATFSPVLRDDAATKRCLAQLLLALSDQAEPAAMTSGYGHHQPSLMPYGSRGTAVGTANLSTADPSRYQMYPPSPPAQAWD